MDMDSTNHDVDRRRNRRGRFLPAASAVRLTICVVVQAAALVQYVRDQSYLEALMSRIAGPTLAPSRQAEAISEYLASKPDDSLDSYFLLPIFRPLRPSAREAAELGGDCADRSRLVIVLLNLRHIRAAKWALYAPDGQSRHAVVELQSEAGNMVIDPLYNMWFPKPGGGFYGIEDLRRDPSILRKRVLALQGDPDNDDIHWYPLNEYVYTNARSINWDKSIVMRAAYRVLRSTFGDRVDHIWRPEFFEQPALMIVFGLLPVDFLILLAIAWPVLKRKRNAGRERVSMSLKTEHTSSF